MLQKKIGVQMNVHTLSLSVILLFNKHNYVAIATVTLVLIKLTLAKDFAHDQRKTQTP